MQSHYIYAVLSNNIYNDPQTMQPLPDNWKEVWGVNVRFAVLYDNEASKANQAVSYSAITVNKHEDPQWIVFPWEEFWKSH